MADIDAKKIAELRSLLAKATLGPWSTHLVDDTTIMSPTREVATTCDSSQTDRVDGYDIEYEQMEADAALIVAMRNALPALLDLASKTLASAREGEDSPAGILDVQRMLTIHQPTGWLARDAVTRIRALASENERLRRERDEARIEYGHMGDDYRELETKLRNTFADVQSMKQRVHAAEAEADALRERMVKADRLLIKCFNRIHPLPRVSDTELADAIAHFRACTALKAPNA